MSHDRNRHSLTVPPATGDHSQGVLNATVVLVLYGDYQSSQSADVYRLIKVMQRQLSVSLRESDLGFIFRHFPQPQIHAQAQRAAEAAEAASAQGQFWQMHDMLFNHQQALGNGYLVEYANQLGLDVCQFLQDLAGKVHLAHINQDLEGALNSGVTDAPTLFINGTRYTDRWNIEQLTAAINRVSH